MKNYSKQREQILNFLKNSKSHPTAEQIYEHLKARKSTISRGTVYRNLGELVEKDVIMKIPVEDCPDKYDYIYKKHNHIICKKCHNIYDIDMEFNLEDVLKENKEIIELDSQLTLYGICKNCKENEEVL